MELFYIPVSNFSRQVLLVGSALGIEFDLKEVRLDKGEHLTPDFIKINPQHTLPTLVDNDLVLIESKAIIMYLPDKYAEDDSLYPKDPQQRALVNQRVFFDTSFFSNFQKFYYPQFTHGAPKDPEQDAAIEKAFQMFDSLLGESEFIAGEFLSIADLCLVTSVSTFEIVGVDVSKFQNVWNWYQRMLNSMPGLDVHKAGVAACNARISKSE